MARLRFCRAQPHETHHFASSGMRESQEGMHSPVTSVTDDWVRAGVGLLI